MFEWTVYNNMYFSDHVKEEDFLQQFLSIIVFLWRLPNSILDFIIPLP